MPADTQPTDFDQINEVLHRVGSSVDAAECHGLLSGLLCAQDTVDSAAWISYVLGGTPDTEAALTEEGRSLLSALLGRVLDQLNDTDYGFEPLLPDDDQPLAMRTAALAEWCQSFLLGLSMGGLKNLEQIPEASAEIIRDMTEITHIDTDDSDASAEDEDAFIEIVEYVRMGVLLIREELRAIKQPRPDDVIVH